MSILGAGAPPPFIPGGDTDTGYVPPGAVVEPDEEGSRFEHAVQEQGGLPSLAEIDIEQMFVAAGVDIDAPLVRIYIEKAAADVASADDEAERQQILAQVQLYLPLLAEQHPSMLVTDYARALEDSGFTGPLTIQGTTTPSELRGIAPSQVATGARSFSVQPETGWIQYANGVLVNPATGALVFDPASDAPGSPAWLQEVQSSWSPEKVAEWRARLVEFGDLSKEQGKVDGIDQAFLTGLQNFHYRRYLNFGKAVPTDLAGIAGAGAVPEFALTAKDFQTQIQADVREQFRRVFGNDPSDAELNEWSRFVTQSAVKAQKAFERKGASPESALSLASTEAEERMIARLEGSPESQFLQDSFAENTRLRDALASAVVTTRSLAG